MSTNTILIDCNRNETTSQSTSLWTNEVGSGLDLNPGDKVSVMSASINEIGSGADTIEFSGDYLGTNADGDKVYDNQATISISYYKVADGDNVLILPRIKCWSNVDASSDDGLPLSSDKPSSYDAGFASLYRRRQDGRRYTIYKGDILNADVAVNTYTKYTQKINLKVDTGYNTPSDISSRLTETLHASSEPTQQTAGFAYSLACPSTVFNLFHCANASNFNESAFDGKTDAYKKAFSYIGVMRPELFEAGNALDNSMMQVKKYTASTGLLVISYKYEKANVDLWKALFDAQRDDPDQAEMLPNSDTTRFIHINYKEATQSGNPMLGNDYDLQYMSVRQTIEHDITFTDTYTDTPTAAQSSYGVMYKQTVDGTEYIAFKVRTSDQRWTGDINTNRYAGWDTHFSAFGNDCCLLWAGLRDTITSSETSVWNADAAALAKAWNVSKYQYVNNVETTITSKNQIKVGSTTHQLSEVVDSVYLGAINPLVNFDSSQSRFFISGLHTPRKQRNTAYAGSSSSTSDALNPNEGEDVYQINPMYDSNSFSFNPEQRSLSSNSEEADVEDSAKINLLDYWKVYDASSGIFIESFGVEESMWEKSLWGKLGFTYLQVNSDRKNRQARGTNQSVNMSPVSTNADVNSTQILDWSVNIWGATQQMSMLPTLGEYAVIRKFSYDNNHYEPKNERPKAPVSETRAKTQIATITETAKSTRIIATNLPVKQTSSHWTIRSSLIDNSQYLSTQGLSPVIAVVDKSYSGSDFYFLSDYNVDFTVTKPSTMTSITTSIHLPDGTLARTDGSSAVIYKIVKMNNAPLSILNDFVKPGKK